MFCSRSYDARNLSMAAAIRRNPCKDHCAGGNPCSDLNRVNRTGQGCWCDAGAVRGLGNAALTLAQIERLCLLSPTLSSTSWKRGRRFFDAQPRASLADSLCPGLLYVVPTGLQMARRTRDRRVREQSRRRADSRGSRTCRTCQTSRTDAPLVLPCSPLSPLYGLRRDQRVPMPTLWTVWKSLPSVLMLGAMMISVS